MHAHADVRTDDDTRLATPLLGNSEVLLKVNQEVAVAGESGLREPRWKLLGLFAAILSIFTLGVLKVIGLPWTAIAGGAIGLGTFFPTLLLAHRKGSKQWAEEDD